MSKLSKKREEHIVNLHSCKVAVEKMNNVEVEERRGQDQSNIVTSWQNTLVEQGPHS